MKPPILYNGIIVMIRRICLQTGLIMNAYFLYLQFNRFIMKFRHIKILPVAMILALFSACGNGISEKLRSGYELDGSEIELEGYLIPDYYTRISDNGEINMNLLPDLYGIGDTIATVIVPFGNDPNSCNITKDRFTSGDIEIIDDSFNKHDYKTKLKIKGIVKYTNKNWASDTILVPDGKDTIDHFTSRLIRAARKDFVQKNKLAAEERQAKTGDPNDYSFVIIVETIHPL